ncbi:unnamed protein product [Lasius platythorax]|uniref:Uncharacterized protein n=1 Tax=Lasius platythorax TaxID=488582 RepID=A0AAV2P2K2_9HYME
MFNGRSIKTTGNFAPSMRKKRPPRSFSFLCAYRPVIRKTWYYPVITSRRRCLVTSSAVLTAAVFSLSRWFSKLLYALSHTTEFSDLSRRDGRRMAMAWHRKQWAPMGHGCRDERWVR